MTCGFRVGPGTIAGGASQISQLAQFLSQNMSRIVLDKTGLEGNYDFEITYTPDQVPNFNGQPGVTQTGMYLNEQPRIKMDMLVQLPGQTPYAAEHSEFVPLILLSRVQPGATLPVKVNPAQPGKVVIDWQSLSSVGVPGMAMAAPGLMAPPPPSSTGTGSGMDESLAQVQAALAGTGAAVPPGFPAIDPNGPSLTTALQEQLGLKLESQRGPVTMFVVDSVSQPTPD